MTIREEYFYSRLKQRTVEDVEVLHVIKNEEGFYCLDFNIKAKEWSALLEAILDKAKSLKLGEIIPAAPRSEWERISNHKDRQLKRVLWSLRRPVLMVVIDA